METGETAQTNRPPSALLREARREDVPQIVALLADDAIGADREGQADEAYYAAFELIAADQRNHLLVAEADGRVVGTLQLTMIPGLSRHGMLRAQIEGVRVSSGQRGQGLGRRMIEWAIDAARGQGCGLVQLTSDKRRPDAVRFYESLGFTASHEGLKLPLLPLRPAPGSSRSARYRLDLPTPLAPVTTVSGASVTTRRRSER